MTTWLTTCFASLTLLVVACAGLPISAQETPIRLHPDNPRWFQWRGEAVALITSAEHYGAVLNADFDYRKYLQTLERQGMNYTRIFTGSYVEPQGAFNIQRNTLAPAKGRFIAPWARSDQLGYAGGGAKFDLDLFDQEYLSRLRDFIAEADRHGVVVEVTLFCSTYSEKQWAVHPLNPDNNIQGYEVPDWKKLNTMSAPVAIRHAQENLTRQLVRELNSFDNFFFEIQNEPWSDNSIKGETINPYLRKEKEQWYNTIQVTAQNAVDWQRNIARVIAEEESHLRKTHMIGQNVSNFRLAVGDADLVPEASIINFHYAYPDAVSWNRGLNRAIGYDETGFAGSDTDTYRRQAWNFILSGGALYNNLDYSFTVGSEDGTDTTNNAPGGGGEELRRQLKVLSEFLHAFDLAQLTPDTTTVLRSSGAVVRMLSKPGKQYALYIEGRNPAKLQLDLPAGKYAVKWLDPRSGSYTAEQSLAAASSGVELDCPKFDGQIAASIVEVP